MSSKQNSEIICEGEPGSNHPRVYITFPVNRDVVKCGYCCKQFVRREQINHADIRNKIIKKPI